MSIEAMWAARFQSNQGGQGAGIIVLETERVFGGDSWYYYVGSYRVDQGRLYTQLKVTHYADNAESIFGPLREFTVALEGLLNMREINLKGQANQDPNLQIQLTMSRIAELP